MTIRDVYADGLETAMFEISKLIDKYTIIGVDTEFPGSFHDHQYVAAESKRLPLSALAEPY